MVLVKFNRMIMSAGVVLGSLFFVGGIVSGQGPGTPSLPVKLAQAEPATNKPAAPKPDKADPAAYALLKAAHDARQVLPVNLTGLTAEVVFDDDGKQSTGTLTYRPQGKSEVQVAGLAEEPKAWLDDQVLSMLGHRRGGDFAQGDGRFPITFGAEGSASKRWGRLVQLNDNFQSAYRVRDNKVVEVTRTMGNLRFTISVLETIQAETGKYLSEHFIVSYRDARTGALQEVQGFRDAYTRLEGTPHGTLWLPSRRLVIFFEKENDSPRMRTITLRNYKVL